MNFSFTLKNDYLIVLSILLRVRVFSSYVDWFSFNVKMYCVVKLPILLCIVNKV